MESQRNVPTLQKYKANSCVIVKVYFNVTKKPYGDNFYHTLQISDIHFAPKLQQGGASYVTIQGKKYKMYVKHKGTFLTVKQVEKQMSKD